MSWIGGVEVEEATRNVRHLTTTVIVGGIDDNEEEEEPGAARVLGLDGIRHVSAMHSTQINMEGGDGEGHSYTAASPQQAGKS